VEPAHPDDTTEAADAAECPSPADSMAAARRRIQAQLDSQTMTPRQVCDVLSISRRTYYRMVEEKIFTPISHRGRVRVPTAEVAAQLDELRAVAGLAGALAASKRSA
jgi:excisionase family DNA binding protein